MGYSRRGAAKGNASSGKIRKPPPLTRHHKVVTILSTFVVARHRVRNQNPVGFVKYFNNLNFRDESAIEKIGTEKVLFLTQYFSKGGEFI